MSAAVSLGHALLSLGRKSAERHRPGVLGADGLRGDYPIAVYFGGGPSNWYQIAPWLPFFAELAAQHPLFVVIRDERLYRTQMPAAPVPLVFVNRLGQLLDLYSRQDVQVILYPSNAKSNFQSLIYTDAMHVELTHGESDKASTASNQVKAYDRALVAGQAAIDRYEAALLGFDSSRLIPCGHPPLDAVIEPTAWHGTGNVVLYAPTWSGENDQNNFSSLPSAGVEITRAILASEARRLLYRPHPRVVRGDRLPSVDRAHKEILRLIAAAPADRAQYVAADRDPLLDLDAAHVFIGDRSAYTLDFLYRHPERPIVLVETDDSAPPTALRHCSYLVDPQAARLGEVLTTACQDDSRARAREVVRKYYFAAGRGESVGRASDAIAGILAEVMTQRSERNSARERLSRRLVGGGIPPGNLYGDLPK